MKNEIAKADKPIALIVLIVNVQELFFTVSTTISHDCTRNRGIGIIEFSLIRNVINFILAMLVLWYSGMGLY